MSKTDTKTFIYYYNSYCQENKTKSKFRLINYHDLQINADQLEKEDWLLLIKALRSDTNILQSISIHSKYLQKQQTSRKSTTQKTSISEPLFFTNSLLNTVIDTLAKCIENSKLLSTICLEGFPLIGNIEYIKKINTSIQKQMNLHSLALPYSRLNDEDVLCLCKTISIHNGIQNIDFTGCGINCEGAKHISTIIRNQKFVRYDETWKQSLRYRLPQPDTLPGLRRITLNNNTNIGDEGFKLIAYELMDDLWIKAVDFQNCGITELSNEFIYDLVNINPTLIILDIRRNKIPNTVIKGVKEKLNRSNSFPDPEGYRWMDLPASSTTSFTTNYKSESKIKLTPTIMKKNNNTNSKINQSEVNKTKSLHQTSVARIIASRSLFSELERTKAALRRVSSNLIEERQKREMIEREHKMFKKNFNEIKACVSNKSNNYSTNNITTQKYSPKKAVKYASKTQSDNYANKSMPTKTKSCSNKNEKQIKINSFMNNINKGIIKKENFNKTQGKISYNLKDFVLKRSMFGTPKILLLVPNTGNNESNNITFKQRKKSKSNKSKKQKNTPRRPMSIKTTQ